MPKPRNYAIYVADMRMAVARALEYVEGQDFVQFSADQKTVDAVLRNFEILGEACGRVPEDIRVRAPEIDWRGIKDFRNVVAHFYSGIDLELVWDLIQKRLPGLERALSHLEASLGKKD